MDWFIKIFSKESFKIRPALSTTDSM